jgi:hypothetical protein
MRIASKLSDIWKHVSITTAVMRNVMKRKRNVLRKEWIRNFLILFSTLSPIEGVA